ncbi:hypothetical protein K491DRAFT_685470 [Lophiostoma macrostomum CBS 122681]|uniref:Uncharacterized protein n=1 Tax=Lophiostoma macrostomum CBS 122681 TaxID=1314788 RepID=A0A6A6SMA9_9PLEO|nr:hypothetical protein K491DRAFT_685470 [Lophiostoma macrostomum CBS 122681]
MSDTESVVEAPSEAPAAKPATPAYCFKITCKSGSGCASLKVLKKRNGSAPNAYIKRKICDARYQQGFKKAKCGHAEELLGERDSRWYCSKCLEKDPSGIREKRRYMNLSGRTVHDPR